MGDNILVEVFIDDNPVSLQNSINEWLRNKNPVVKDIKYIPYSWKNGDRYSAMIIYVKDTGGGYTLNVH